MNKSKDYKDGFDAGISSMKIMLDDMTDELIKIRRCLAKTFHPEISLPARIMNLWQYYEAYENKFKSMPDDIKAYETLYLNAKAESEELREIIIKFGSFIYADNCGVPIEAVDRKMIESDYKKFISLNSNEPGSINALVKCSGGYKKQNL